MSGIGSDGPARDFQCSICSTEADCLPLIWPSMFCFRCACWFLAIYTGSKVFVYSSLGVMGLFRKS